MGVRASGTLCADIHKQEKGGFICRQVDSQAMWPQIVTHILPPALPLPLGGRALLARSWADAGPEGPEQVSFDEEIKMQS